MKVWRVVWLGKDIVSVEMVAPDLQRAAQKAATRSGMSAAEQAHMETVGVDVLRAALIRCQDMPNEHEGHACYVEGADVPAAFSAAKSKHPDWSPS